jgi:hypothetical protein
MLNSEKEWIEVNLFNGNSSGSNSGNEDDDNYDGGDIENNEDFGDIEG